MSVTQTVEIPADHRLTIDVPREIPAGPVVLTFTPKAIPKSEEKDGLSCAKGQFRMAGDLDAPLGDTEGFMKAIEECDGLFKRLGINLSSDEFLEMRRQDKELEDRLDR